jgi:hypothetical protein
LPVAVTTATLLGVAIPVIVCGVEPVVVDAGAADPLQPASRAATAAAATVPRSLIRNLLRIISNTSVLEISARQYAATECVESRIGLDGLAWQRSDRARVGVFGRRKREPGPFRCEQRDDRVANRA